MRQKSQLDAFMVIPIEREKKGFWAGSYVGFQ